MTKTWKWIREKDYPQTHLVPHHVEHDDPDIAQKAILSIYESHGGGHVPSDENMVRIARIPVLEKIVEMLADAEGNKDLMDAERAAKKLLGNRGRPPFDFVPDHSNATGEFFMVGPRQCGKMEMIRKTSSHRYSIQSLAGTGYHLKKPMEVLIREDEQGFVVSFFEANVHASGETIGNAMDMFRDALTQRFRFLAELMENECPDEMGEEGKRQLAVLREFVEPAEK